MDSKNRFEQRCCLYQFLLIIGLSAAMVTYFRNVKHDTKKLQRVHEDNFSAALKVTGTILLVVSSLALIIGLGQLFYNQFFSHSKNHASDDVEEGSNASEDTGSLMDNRSESILSFAVASELVSTESLNTDWMKDYGLVNDDPPPKYEDIMMSSTTASSLPHRIVTV